MHEQEKSTLPPYNKPPLSFEQQAALQLERKLEGISHKELTESLKNINYYRFTGYLYHRRKKNSDDYKPGTTFEMFKHLYNFDTELRLILFKAIARLEVAFRTRLIGFCSVHTKDPFFHKKIEELKYSHREDHRTKQFFEKYNTNPGMPIWALCEHLGFGDIITIFKNIKLEERYAFLKSLKRGLNYKAFIAWLISMKDLRNACAHHDQIVGWAKSASIARIDAVFPHTKEKSFFAVLCILKYLLDVFAIPHTLGDDLTNLFKDYSLSSQWLGMPENWHTLSPWPDVVWTK